MLNEIQYRYKIGRKKDQWIILENLKGISQLEYKELYNIAFKSISRDSNLDDAIVFLKTIKILEVNDTKINQIKSFSNIDEFVDYANIEVMTELIEQNELNIFLGSSIRYNVDFKRFYVNINDISLKYSGLRDFLIDTEMLYRFNDLLCLNEQFYKLYKKKENYPRRVLKDKRYSSGKWP